MTPTELDPNSEQGEHFWSGGSRRDVSVLTAGCWNAAASLSDRPPFTGCCYIRRHPQLHLTTHSTGAEAVGPQRRSGPGSGSRYLPGWSFVGAAAFRRFKSRRRNALWTLVGSFIFIFFSLELSVRGARTPLGPPVNARFLRYARAYFEAFDLSPQTFDSGAVLDPRPCRNVDSDGQLQPGRPRSMLSMKRFGSLRRSKKRKEQDGLSRRPQSEASCLCGNHHPPL